MAMDDSAFRSANHPNGGARSSDAVNAAIYRWFSMPRSAEVPKTPAARMPAVHEVKQIFLLHKVLQKLELLDNRTKAALRAFQIVISLLLTCGTRGLVCCGWFLWLLLLICSLCECWAALFHMPRSIRKVEWLSFTHRFQRHTDSMRAAHQNPTRPLPQEMQMTMDTLERAAVAHGEAMDTAQAMIHGSDEKIERLSASAEAAASRHAEAARAWEVLLALVTALLATIMLARHRHLANRILRRVPFSLCMMLQVASCAALGAARASEALHSMPLLGPLFTSKPHLRLGALGCLYSASALLPYKVALELLASPSAANKANAWSSRPSGSSQ